MEEKEERKVWSECLLCKREYSDDIRMNKCLHSYCRECIEQDKYALSLLCPICHEPFLSQASSLPKNYSLLYWRSISPPDYNSTSEINKIDYELNNNNVNNNLNNKVNMKIENNDNNDNKLEKSKNFNITIDLLKLNENSSNKRIKIKEESELNDSQSLSSSLSSSSSSSSITTTITIKDVSKNGCEECEENKSEYYCKECKSFLCYLCSKQIHTLKIMKNHSIIDSQSYYSSLNNNTNDNNNENDNNDEDNNNNNNNNSESKDEINYYNCDIHDKKKKELYCDKCEECVCVLCIDKHRNHLVFSIIDKLENLKSNWIENILTISKKYSQNFSTKEENLKKKIEEINEEIFQLKEKLENLEEKKSSIHFMVNEIIETKENIDFTSLFLTHFIKSLPPLPLSSFLYPNKISDNIINNNKNIKNNNNNNNNNIDDTTDEKKKKKTIKNFFEINNLENIFSSVPHPSNITKYIDDPNKYLITNQLVENLNLISNFGSKGKKNNQFNCPNYLSFNDRLNLLGVSDLNNERIQIFNRKGTLLRTFPIKFPKGIMIIPSLHLLAIVSQLTNEIQIFDISQTEKLNKKKIIKDPFPLCYSIGKKDKLNLPTGLGYSDHKKLLAVGNYGEKNIKIFSIKKEGYNIHSIINLSSKPSYIALSTPGDHLLVSSIDNSIKLFKWSAENEGEKMKWKDEGPILLPSFIAKFRDPMGVAIHSSVLRSYFIICDCSKFNFFDLTTRKLIFQYRPSANISKVPFFYRLWGISVDDEANLIAVSDHHSHSVSVFRSLL